MPIRARALRINTVTMWSSESPSADPSSDAHCPALNVTHIRRPAELVFPRGPPGRGLRRFPSLPATPAIAELSRVDTEGVGILLLLVRCNDTATAPPPMIHEVLGRSPAPSIPKFRIGQRGDLFFESVLRRVLAQTLFKDHLFVLSGKPLEVLVV